MSIRAEQMDADGLLNDGLDMLAEARRLLRLGHALHRDCVLNPGERAARGEAMNWSRKRGESDA